MVRWEFKILTIEVVINKLINIRVKVKSCNVEVIKVVNMFMINTIEIMIKVMHTFIKKVILLKKIDPMVLMLLLLIMKKSWLPDNKIITTIGIKVMLNRVLGLKVVKQHNITKVNIIPLHILQPVMVKELVMVKDIQQQQVMVKELVKVVM